MVRQPVTAAAAVLYHQTSMKIRLSRCVALTVKILPDGTSGILPCGFFTANRTGRWKPEPERDASSGTGTRADGQPPSALDR